MNTVNPVYFVDQTMGRSKLNGIDMVVTLEADNDHFFVSVAPGIDKSVAARFHCEESWERLNDFCKSEKRKTFKNITEVNHYTEGILFPPKHFFEHTDTAQNI